MNLNLVEKQEASWDNYINNTAALSCHGDNQYKWILVRINNANCISTHSIAHLNDKTNKKKENDPYYDRNYFGHNSLESLQRLSVCSHWLLFTGATNFTFMQLLKLRTNSTVIPYTLRNEMQNKNHWHFYRPCPSLHAAGLPFCTSKQDSQ